MIKRGVIKLGAMLPIFRVSKPGIDVDTAGPEDLLIHEDAVFLQPYYFGFVSCPFASYRGYDSKDELRTVTVPNIGQVPAITFWQVEYTDIIAYPTLLSEGSGNSQNGYNITQGYTSAKFIEPSSVQFRFMKAAGSYYPPKGCYMMLTRSANA
jgi:hypothetical protein